MSDTKEIKFKITTLDGEFRRIRFSAPPTLSEFIERVAEIAPCKRDIRLRYLDEEGDLITVASQTEWAEAMDILGKEDVKKISLAENGKTDIPVRTSDGKRMFVSCDQLERLSVGLLFLQNNEPEKARTVFIELIQDFPKDRVSHYNLACALSMMRAKSHLPEERRQLLKGAITHLKKAVELGYANHDHLASDKDFDDIKNTEEFIAIIEDIKRKETEKENELII